MGKLHERIQKIEYEIQQACERSGRNRSDITIVAVTKEVSTARAIQVMEAGILELGENRTESLLCKQETIQKDAVWHFIGNVQSRKIKDMIDDIDFLHSVDRISIVKEIQKRATRVIDCFVQVNVSGEVSKSGLIPAEIPNFIEEIVAYDKIRVIGLMTMAPNTEDTGLIRSVFSSLKELRDEIAALKLPNAPCLKLSMGMSNDFIIAIEEGATHVRIGTALVGAESEGDL